MPYETFDTADRPIAVAVGSERQWPRFCEVLGLPELAVDPRFATNGLRVESRAGLRPILAARFRERGAGAWLDALAAASIPCAPINDVVAAFAADAAMALEMVVEQEHPAWGVIRQVGVPFRLSATPASIRTPPPELGEHADEILGEVGYSASQVATLRADGVV